ncbi:uncharacterized protein L969DRAFT_88967 [Mixia osmundae IAM 14324]|uniref:Dolichyl-diphosphooligosaccharide--protein glycosyltransferase subunit WBP1 n=1 Tax=Mixia osmundae (strain CBS 9802 / IAM 14324 / JCM 22182 / KY 12970) TaxID=764103 RepID=G7E7W1_MIXOS|nr:uncharacterized protein L969DRAFT_88967 [Mixia osmundae IAM 14324]KEI38522.1 hypothetical protein L969DRAFT_88967 [Mixia osmundae IAM 14324]GAA98921.1 hypothetical protein E5Q_05609 [Mixia osmundae IAM 14324]
MRLLSSLVVLCNALSAALARSSSGDRVLVVLDAAQDQASYSHFWSSLQERGFELTFRGAKEGAALYEYDAPMFDHIILFAPSAKALSSDLSPQRLVDFLTSDSTAKASGILLALSSDLSELWRDFAREFSLEFDDRGSSLVSHSSGNLSAVQIDTSYSVTTNAHFVARLPPALPLQYNGVVHTFTQLPLLTNIVRAPPESYSRDPQRASDEGPFVSGEQAGLISAMQTLNNGRIVFSGSLDVFANCDESVANSALVGDLSRWTFHEKAVLRVLTRSHRRLIDGEGAQPPSEYRVGEEMAYSIALQEYNGKDWVAFEATDIQLEVSMLTPHLRITLPKDTVQSTSDVGVYSAQFALPDQHGVFTLRVDYRRPGLTWTTIKDQISITPLRHNEYPRFITGAIPYYAGASSVSLALIVFASLWLRQ